jgi:spore maturation protein SpmB
VVLLAALPMLSRKKDYFAAFVAGAKNGLSAAVRLLPVMVALMTALSMLEASGALTHLSAWLARPAAALGIPAELIPLLLTRPVSGSASTAAYASLLDRYGPDSFVCLCGLFLRLLLLVLCGSSIAGAFLAIRSHALTSFLRDLSIIKSDSCAPVGWDITNRRK